MAKNEQAQKSQGSSGGNVVSIVLDRCKVDSCKSKAERAGFCSEHFIWFKEGLITIEGHQAKDFEKKYQQFMKSKKKKIA